MLWGRLIYFLLVSFFWLDLWIIYLHIVLCLNIRGPSQTLKHSISQEAQRKGPLDQGL